MDATKEKITEFEDVAIETRISCKYIPVLHCLDFLYYIFTGRTCTFLKYILRRIQVILTEALIPCTVSNCWWFNRNWNEEYIHRKSSWHWIIFMTSQLRVSVLGNVSTYMALWLVVIKNSMKMFDNFVKHLCLQNESPHFDDHHYAIRCSKVLVSILLDTVVNS